MQTLSGGLPLGKQLDRPPPLWTRLKRRIARARADARLRAELKYELQCLDEAGELDGALANLGLSRAAVPVLLQRYPGTIRRYRAMTQRLGVPLLPQTSLLAGLAGLAGPQRRCLFCAESRECEDWLAAGATAGHRAFCPNADAFERMKQRA